MVPSNSNNLTNFSSRPVPQKRETSVSVKNSDSKKNSSSKDQNKVNKQQQPRPEIKEKPTFSTFKQFHRTASLSDLLDDVNEDEEIVKPEVIPKKRLNKRSSENNTNFHLETASLASVNVNVPDPILPPTKSITVQTDEDLEDLSLEVVQNSNSNINAKSDPLKISTEPLNGEAAEVSLSTSFDSMDDSKSKSTDVSMEDALQTLQNVSKVVDDDEDEDDLPTPPETPPLEERLKSPVSTTSRSPPSPKQTMTPTRKVRLIL